ncbi:hypothetical protein L596_028751 [Steinernema carpocapsae]|uniref:RING-type E3 ubiquitin transferase n=2 Tax=Steinernema carpocapsae TaxID=34508 RepID=A0A4U5LZ96_STECR|nr:hypothetical protein L596_028751 [Steinernema carpocapsae]
MDGREQWALSHLHSTPEMSEEQAICRICLYPSEELLFHPCKCSGSIKFVHNTCWKRWTENGRSRKKCELCGHEFEFQNVLKTNHKVSWTIYIQSFLKYLFMISSLIATLIFTAVIVHLVKGKTFPEVVVALTAIVGLLGLLFKHVIGYADQFWFSCRLPFVGDVNSSQKITKTTFWDILKYDVSYYIMTAAVAVSLAFCGTLIIKANVQKNRGEFKMPDLWNFTTLWYIEWILPYLPYIVDTSFVFGILTFARSLSGNGPYFISLHNVLLTCFGLTKVVYASVQRFCVGWFVDEISNANALTKTVVHFAIYVTMVVIANILFKELLQETGERESTIPKIIIQQALIFLFTCLSFCSIFLFPLDFASFFSPSNKLNLGPFNVEEGVHFTVIYFFLFFYKILLVELKLIAVRDVYCEAFDRIREYLSEWLERLARPISKYTRETLAIFGPVILLSIPVTFGFWLSLNLGRTLLSYRTDDIFAFLLGFSLLELPFVSLEKTSKTLKVLLRFSQVILPLTLTNSKLTIADVYGFAISFYLLEHFNPDDKVSKKTMNAVSLALFAICCLTVGRLGSLFLALGNILYMYGIQILCVLSPIIFSRSLNYHLHYEINEREVQLINYESKESAFRKWWVLNKHKTLVQLLRSKFRKFQDANDKND